MTHLTIPDQEATVTYSAATGSGPYNVTFPITSSLDLRVAVGGVELASSAFTFTPTTVVTGGYQAGYITLATAAAAEDVVVWRDIPLIRDDDFANGPLPMDALNTALDRLTAQVQDARNVRNMGGVTPSQYAVAAVLQDFLGTPTTLIEAQTELGVRANAEAAVTIYWAAAADGGSDSNDGTSTAPFATFSRAMTEMRKYDARNQTLKIKRLGTTTISERLDIDSSPVGLRNDYDFVVEGDTTTPANCTISTSLSCIAVHGGARVKIHGFKLVSATGQGITSYEDARVTLGVMDFGACGQAHMQAADGHILRSANWTVSGDAPQHIVVEVGGGSVDLNPDNYTTTAVGTRTFSDVIFDVGEQAVMSIHAATWVGTWVGTRYREWNGGKIVPHTQVVNLPGTAGTGSSTDYLTSLYLNESSLTSAMRGLIRGLTLSNNGSDATNDIDIAAGHCVDSTGVVLMSISALTKRSDANFTAGTNQGALDTGAVGNGTYHVFGIYKDADGSGDILFSLSATSPTMPSGYTKFRRIGSFIRSGGAILAFTQRGDVFRLSTPVLDIDNAAASSSAVTRTLASLPTGIVVEGILGLQVVAGATTNAATFMSSLTEADVAATPAVNQALAIGASTNSPQSRVTGIFTNTSAQVRTRDRNTDQTTRITTYGWIDRRGRDD